MKLTTLRPGVIRLDGVLTMDSAADTLPLLQQAVADGADTLDLAGVSQCDSAALALLLALRRHAGSNTLQLENVPQTLYGLAHLYELSTLLGLTQEA